MMKSTVEIWVDVKRNNNYSISNTGKIINKKNGKQLKASKDKNGYMAINLGRKCRTHLHRLLAEAFIPNPDNKSEVDHINTIRDDNRLENLRWVTKKEQMNNPLTIEHQRNTSKTMVGIKAKANKPIYQFDINGNFIKEWLSARLADNELNISYKSISQNLRGKSKSAGGYIWKYA